MTSDIDVAGLILNNTRDKTTNHSATNTTPKPRALGKIRVQGLRSQPDKRHSASSTKTEDFNVQGESYVPPKTTPQEKKYTLLENSVPKPTPQPQSTDNPNPKPTKKEPDNTSAKKLEEALKREKSLKDLVQQLQTEVASAEVKINKTTSKISDYENKVKEITEENRKYKKLYEQELANHEKTQQQLQIITQEKKTLKTDLENKIDKLKRKVDETKKSYESLINDMTKTHQENLADKEKRIENLKKQIAGTLGSNSHERQSQIDDLSKELQKVTEELENLRRRQKTSGQCSQCVQNKAIVKEQEDKMKALIEACTKFKGRLGEQEELLNILTKSNTGSKPKR